MPHRPTMYTVGLGLALSTLLVVGCATLRPDFERRFHGGRTSHDLWMSILSSRYGCDTSAVVANKPGGEPLVGLGSLTRAPERRMQVGMTACNVANLVVPEEIAAWVGPEGIREEWKFRVDTGPLTSVYLEGRQERALRVVPPVPQ